MKLIKIYFKKIITKIKKEKKKEKFMDYYCNPSAMGVG